MNINEQLYGKHLPERTELERQQKEELNKLFVQHATIRQKQELTPELNKRLEQEIQDMQRKHSQQGQELLARQEKEFQDELATQQQKSKIENDEIERNRTALNIQYAEEREKTRQKTAAYQQEGESLLEKIKRQWAKTRDQDRDR